jgi:hypothetical protein
MKIRICAISISLGLVAACASTAPQPATVAPVATAPLTVASIGTPAPGVTEAQQLQFVKLAAHLGYRVELVNNQRHYCKLQEVTESHLAHKDCVNEEQMAAKIKAGPDARKNDLPMNGGNAATFTRTGPTKQ